MAYVTLEDFYGDTELLVFPKTFTKYRHLLNVGGIVIVCGRVSQREDEDTKIMASDIYNIDDVSDGLPDGRQRQERAAPPPVSKAPEGKSMLYLRVEGTQSAEERKAMLAILEFFGGQTPVCLCENGKRFMADAKYWVEPSDFLVEKLTELLGEGNVVLKGERQ